MRETLRTRMGWLHAWTGFVGGLVMVCVFVTGSLSVFDTEITRWMQPEVRVAPGTPLTPAALDVAARMIHEGETHGIPAFLALPSPRSPTLKVLHYDGREFTGPQLDPQTGVIIPARQTAGGEFFFRFHYTLCMQGPAGILAVDIPAIGLLVAIGSGLVIHIRALLPDIVLLRLSATRLRAWLDAHLLTGVLFLPFMVMITYTGVLVHVDRLLPAIPVTSLWSQGRPVSRSTAIRPPHVAPSPVFQPLPPIAPLLAAARAPLGGREAGFILFSPDHLSIFASDASGPFLTRDHADFHLPDGALLATAATSGSIARSVQLLHGLHYARFAATGLRWLYLVSGLFATAVIASGLVLFGMKRRRDRGHTVAFRIGEGLTMTTLVGLPASLCALLWASRLLPATLPGRDGTEITVFFTVWGLCALHALTCAVTGRGLRAWRTQLAMSAVLAGGLLPLDGLTAPAALHAAPAIHAAVDGMGLGAASLALYVLSHLRDRAA